MNAIQKLSQDLSKELPGLTVYLDPPEDPQATYWLNLEYQGHTAVVEWRPRHGFGLSAPAQGEYGQGSDELVPSLTTARERLVRLLRYRESTEPPRQVALRKLRESRRLSQQKLASELHVRQATISKLERRSDMYISTLRRVIEAMGGNLEIRAHFPEGVVKITQFEELREDDSVRGANAANQ